MKLNGQFIEHFHIVNALSPSADLFNTSPVSDVISLAQADGVVFLVHQKANATSTAGTGTMKPQQVDNPAASNAVDLPFRYAKKTTGASSVWGDVTAVAAASTVAITANEDTIFAIEVDARDLADGKKYVQLKLTEVVNAPILGSVQAILFGGRYGYPFSFDPLA